MKVYLDCDLVSAIAKKDFGPAEQAVLEQILTLPQLERVTSEVTRREIAGYGGPQRQDIERVYELLRKVPIVEDIELLGIRTQWDPYGGQVSSPWLQEEEISQQLRAIGLTRMDAQHLMVAIRAGCDVFLTYDRHSIVRYRPAIEAVFTILVRTPLELAEQLRSGGANSPTNSPTNRPRTP